MILNIYKPVNWTSFDVVAKLRGILHTRKIGHAGTLDPLAQGVLVVLTDSDTKKQDNLMHQEKEYEADFVFGAASPTYDLEGPLELSHTKITLDALKAQLPNFLGKYIGEFEQKIPAYSAKRQNGKKLYELARAGKITQETLPTKKVNVKSLTITNYFFNESLDLPSITVKITCDSGFYVRSLAHDLGEDLGCGAVTTRILRTRVGDYKVEDSVTIESILG
ncbi:tRNA pseudouridine(55) synthase TruB [candidate division WWE3 bacterium]|nr:tRNA pseudouridine(55) synthase TruB [candidate division WWE3 bacterium]